MIVSHLYEFPLVNGGQKKGKVFRYNSAYKLTKLFVFGMVLISIKLSPVLTIF